MKKIVRISCLCLTALLFFGCANEKTNSKITASNSNTATKQELKQDDGKYKNNITEAVKDLNDRIDFDYNEALVKHNFEFLAFNEDDIKKAQLIFDTVKEKYSQIKKPEYKDINLKVESVINKYSEVLNGRHLVLQHKGDDKFLSTGYSQNVVVPINDIKKLKDDLQSSLLK